MKSEASEVAVYFVILLTWIAGFVVSKGFWAMAFCVIPFWAWYQLIEFFFKLVGWI